jgi:hypothetical protein
MVNMNLPFNHFIHGLLPRSINSKLNVILKAAPVTNLFAGGNTMKIKTLIVTALITLVLVTSAFAGLKARDFRKLVGYTVIEITNVVGNFDGADFDKVVALDNGMVFMFNEYNYSYAYRPDVVILAKKVTIGKDSALLWMLIIEDELYDATRVK